MPGCPAPINRAGAVAWCTEKRGMPSLPYAESGSRWSEDRRCAAFGRCQRAGNWMLGTGWGRLLDVGFYIGNGSTGSGWMGEEGRVGNRGVPVDVLRTAAARLTATLRTRAPQSSPMPWCNSSRVGRWDVCDIASTASNGAGMLERPRVPYPTADCKLAEVWRQSGEWMG
jgi:hypothetical protein